MKTGIASRLETYGALAGAMLAILAFFGTIGRPYAESLVNDVLDSRIKKLEESIDELQTQRAADRIEDRAVRSRMETEIQNTKELQKEVRGDVKLLLRSVQQLDR